MLLGIALVAFANLCFCLAGRIENWRLGADGDDLLARPYFTQHADSPNFNRLFAALYDAFFSKLTKMAQLTPSPGRTITDVFLEKIHGSDKYLVSAEIVAYLKWLIYIAAFKERGNVAHEVFYNTELAYLKKPENGRWRSFLCAELLEWYKEFPPSKKRKSRSSGQPIVEIVEVTRVMKNVDGFVDPLEHLNGAPPPAAGGGGGAA